MREDIERDKRERAAKVGTGLSVPYGGYRYITEIWAQTSELESAHKTCFTY